MRLMPLVEQEEKTTSQEEMMSEKTRLINYLQKWTDLQPIQT